MLGYDSDEPSAIPADAELVAGYDDGENGTWTAADFARFPSAIYETIARKPGVSATWGDCEPGCLWPIPQAVSAWQEGAVEGLYVDEANWADLRAAIAAAGLSAPPYWVAAYPDRYPSDPVVPQDWIELGCVRWQFADPATSGGHFDVSVTAPGYPIPPVAPPTTTGRSSDVGVFTRALRPDLSGVDTIFIRRSDGKLVWDGDVPDYNPGSLVLIDSVADKPQPTPALEVTAVWTSATVAGGRLLVSYVDASGTLLENAMEVANGWKFGDWSAVGGNLAVPS